MDILGEHGIQVQYCAKRSTRAFALIRANVGHGGLWEETVRNHYSNSINLGYFPTYPFSQDSEKHSLFLFFSVLTICFIWGFQRDVRQGFPRALLLFQAPMGKGSSHVVWNFLKRSSWGTSRNPYLFLFLILPKRRMSFPTRFRAARQPQAGCECWCQCMVSQICPVGDSFLCLSFLFCAWFLSLSANIQWKKLRAEPKAVMKHSESWRLISGNNLEMLVFLASLPLSPTLPHHLVWTDHSVYVASLPKFAFITSTIWREILVMKPLCYLSSIEVS